MKQNGTFHRQKSYLVIMLLWRVLDLFLKQNSNSETFHAVVYLKIYWISIWYTQKKFSKPRFKVLKEARIGESVIFKHLGNVNVQEHFYWLKTCRTSVTSRPNDLIYGFDKNFINADHTRCSIEGTLNLQTSGLKKMFCMFHAWHDGYISFRKTPELNRCCDRRQCLQIFCICIMEFEGNVVQ